jgi:hypothetical protein
MLFAEWQVGQVVLSMLWFSLLFMWIWVVIVVFADIFRSRDLSGWSKALWTLFVLFLPLIGVLSYLIARGSKIGEHNLQDAEDADRRMRAYIRSTVDSPTDDLSTLTSLRDRGVIDEAEYQAMKARVPTA